MKTLWIRGVDHFGKAFRNSLKDWPVILVASLAFAYLGFTFFFTNPYQFYVPTKLAQSLVSVPFLFLGLSYLLGLYRLSDRPALTKQNWAGLIVWCAALAAAAFFIFPNPRPLLTQNHRLVISASGEKNRFASDSIVEIRQVKSLDGKPVAFDQFQTSGDWENTGTELYSPNGGPGSTVERSGAWAGGVSLSLRYLPDAGKVTIQWDQTQKVIDLYTSSAATIEEFIFDGFDWGQLSWIEASWVVLSLIAYFTGLFLLALILSLFIRGRFLPRRVAQVGLLLAYLAIFIWFAVEKFSYTGFTGNRPFFDSRAYIQTADYPINSISFWAGERSFTFPLALKLLDVHYAENWPNLKMEQVELLHIGLSIASWVLLAFLASLKVRQNWLKPLAFAGILAFSLNLEIGIWDSLMLSESLSLSFFALLVAYFMGGQFLSPARRPWLQWVFFASWSLVAVLYSFARDSNQYFLLIAAGIYLVRILLKYRWDQYKRLGLIFMTIIVLILGLQTASILTGNRWQIFLYDHLAMRILPDTQATAFFAAHGLPVSADLLKLVGMNTGAYQEILVKDPQMQPVRDWVNQSGKTTYLLYLFNQLGDSLIAPIQQVSSLLDGQTVAYEYPTYYSHPYSDEIGRLSNFFYFRTPLIEWIAGIGLLAAVILWAMRGRADSAWFIVALLAVSLYPMMFIVWHGEPLEIERHALQIGIQFRLVAWLALFYAIDFATQRVLVPNPETKN